MADEQPCCDAQASIASPRNRFFVEAVVTIDERGQMVLPKAIRERAGLQPGDKLAVSVMESKGSVCCINLIRTEQIAQMVKEMLGPLMSDVIKE
jgi:antitoxin PrlF